MVYGASDDMRRCSTSLPDAGQVYDFLPVCQAATAEAAAEETLHDVAGRYRGERGTFLGDAKLPSVAT